MTLDEVEDLFRRMRLFLTKAAFDLFVDRFWSMISCTFCEKENIFIDA